jgi:hypothetical protein
MIHVYYHIYAVEGVEQIIDEQLSLIDTHFDFPYILNIGISIGNDNKPNEWVYDNIIKRQKSNWKIRDIRAKGNEFVTLDLLEKDKNKFGDSDYILYLHTKGASRQSNIRYRNIVSWRQLMNYHTIELNKNVFNLFEKTNYNTYGVLFCNVKGHNIYGGNFWWAKGRYLKTLNMENVNKNRNNAEWSFIQTGIDWKPYSPYNINSTNPYAFNFKREEYIK